MQDNNNNINYSANNYNSTNSNTEFNNVQNNIVNNEQNSIYNRNKTNIESVNNYVNQTTGDNTKNEEKFYNDTGTTNEILKALFSKLFYRINMYYIVPGLFTFGLIFAFFSPLSDISKLSYILVLLICLGYPISMVLLVIIHRVRTIRNDVNQNGFTIFGKTTAEKIKSILLLCFVVLSLIMFFVYR